MSYISHTKEEIAEMLASIGVSSIKFSLLLKPKITGKIKQNKPKSKHTKKKSTNSSINFIA
jgi:glycine cleavage system pyridoxal-binding protein P